MALTAGTRLGPYAITAQIGEGGMGEVYRATDTTLNRQVAIKVLPESLASDAEQVAVNEAEGEKGRKKTEAGQRVRRAAPFRRGARPADCHHRSRSAISCRRLESHLETSLPPPTRWTRRPSSGHQQTLGRCSCGRRVHKFVSLVELAREDR